MTPEHNSTPNSSDETLEKEPYVAPQVESVGLSDDAADSLT